jgi:hypothetical protein
MIRHPVPFEFEIYKRVRLSLTNPNILQKFRSAEVKRGTLLSQSGSAIFAYASADIAAQIFFT